MNNEVNTMIKAHNRRLEAGITTAQLIVGIVLLALLGSLASMAIYKGSTNYEAQRSLSERQNQIVNALNEANKTISNAQCIIPGIAATNTNMLTALADRTGGGSSFVQYIIIPKNEVRNGAGAVINAEGLEGPYVLVRREWDTNLDCKQNPAFPTGAPARQALVVDGLTGDGTMPPLFVYKDKMGSDASSALADTALVEMRLTGLISSRQVSNSGGANGKVELATSMAVKSVAAASQDSPDGNTPQGSPSLTLTIVDDNGCSLTSGCNIGTNGSSIGVTITIRNNGPYPVSKLDFVNGPVATGANSFLDGTCRSGIGSAYIAAGASWSCRGTVANVYLDGGVRARVIGRDMTTGIGAEAEGSYKAITSGDPTPCTGAGCDVRPPVVITNDCFSGIFNTSSQCNLSLSAYPEDYNVNRLKWAPGSRVMSGYVVQRMRTSPLASNALVGGTGSYTTTWSFGAGTLSMADTSVELDSLFTYRVCSVGVNQVCSQEIQVRQYPTSPGANDFSAGWDTLDKSGNPVDGTDHFSWQVVRGIDRYRVNRAAESGGQPVWGEGSVVDQYLAASLPVKEYTSRNLGARSIYFAGAVNMCHIMASDPKVGQDCVSKNQAQLETPKYVAIYQRPPKPATSSISSTVGLEQLFSSFTFPYNGDVNQPGANTAANANKFCLEETKGISSVFQNRFDNKFTFGTSAECRWGLRKTTDVQMDPSYSEGNPGSNWTYINSPDYDSALPFATDWIYPYYSTANSPNRGQGGFLPGADGGTTLTNGVLKVWNIPNYGFKNATLNTDIYSSHPNSDAGSEAWRFDDWWGRKMLYAGRVYNPGGWSDEDFVRASSGGKTTGVTTKFNQSKLTATPTTQAAYSPTGPYKQLEPVMSNCTYGRETRYEYLPGPNDGDGNPTTIKSPYTWQWPQGVTVTLSTNYSAGLNTWYETNGERYHNPHHADGADGHPVQKPTPQQVSLTRSGTGSITQTTQTWTTIGDNPWPRRSSTQGTSYTWSLDAVSKGVCAPEGRV